MFQKGGWYLKGGQGGTQKVVSKKDLIKKDLYSAISFKKQIAIGIFKN